MNLHEYQAKDILELFGVKVPMGLVAFTPDEAVVAAKKISKETGSRFWVIKAQIHAGGRGKGGGVKTATSFHEVREKSSQILGMRLLTPQTSKEGKIVHRIMVAQDVYYPGASEPKEYYLSILMDRSKGKNIIVYSDQGGMDVEEVAEKNPEKIFTEEIDPIFGIQAFQARRIAFNLGLNAKAFKEFISFITALYKAYIAIDALLFEINPMLKTSDDQIMAVDAKIVIDDNALYRHPEYAAMRDTDQEDPTEVEASKSGLNFVKLQGNVGCMVNGAGLAMATMDMIKTSGGNPANFLDVGGTADAQRVEKALHIILKDESVSAVLINIFGGIVRCDLVAEGIIQACKNRKENLLIPIILRLQGTHSEQAKEMINQSMLQVHSVVTLKEAAGKVQELLT